MVLGVAEKGEGYEIVGVRSPAKLIKAFWDGHNNPQKFSPAICTEGDVQLVPIDGRELLLIRVRRAARAQRPVFVNGNPLTGTYKRNFEGDYHCTEAEVRQMLRDTPREVWSERVLAELEPGDIVLTMSSGSFGGLPRRLADALPGGGRV